MTRELRAGFDRVVRTAALGVLFRDAIDQRVVADGLSVELSDGWRPQAAGLRLAANRSGVFVAHRLPGRGPSGAAETVSPPADAPGRWRLSVRDAAGRYLPLRLALDAIDLTATGWVEPMCLPADSPPGRDAHVPLYSAPARPLAGAGMAVLRAELRLASNPAQPARWAWVEMRLDGEPIASGIADARGALLLACPQPPPRERALRSSPAMAPSPQPGGAGWQVSLHARWHVARLAEDVPELCDVRSQPAVDLLARLTPPVPLGDVTLAAGETARVASAGSSFLYVAA